MNEIPENPTKNALIRLVMIALENKETKQAALDFVRLWTEDKVSEIECEPSSS